MRSSPRPAGAAARPTGRSATRALVVGALVTVAALATGCAPGTDGAGGNGARLDTPAAPGAPARAAVESPATVPASVPAPTPAALRRVLLVGDGIMFDLAPPLAAHLGAVGVEVTDRSYWGMGLTRPDRFDWEQRWATAVAETRPDAVVVTVGPNDAEPRPVGDRVLIPGTAAWAAWYSALLDRAATVLHGSGAPVYWIGMLPSGDPALADEVLALNDAVRALAARDPDVRYVDPRDGLGAVYRETTDDPQPRRLRQPDGKHLCAEGAARVTPVVIDAFRARFAVDTIAADTIATVPAWRDEPRYESGGPDCRG